MSEQNIPDPQVLEKAKRRRFTAEYKLRILKETDACTEPGELGSLLRHEGLYSSSLAVWRKQREAGTLAGLSKKRGRKAQPATGDSCRIKDLERENRHLQRKLKQSETIIAVQKKLCQLLEIAPADEEERS
jgi:transposase